VHKNKQLPQQKLLPMPQQRELPQKLPINQNQ
jgi:hypothetical protein